MRITRIQRKRGGRGGVILHLDGEARYELAVDVVRDAGLRVGDDIDEPELSTLLAADQRHRARAAALRLLAVRARSRAELRRRLRARQLPEEVIEDTLASLEGAGLVDDDAFARSFTRDRIRLRPRGRAAIAAELRARGVAAAAAEAAVEQVFADEETSDLGLARAAA
ncbi:MAG TPA: RecX family transcriptional regulator, partial [Longimicrobiales bacterium]|nr:RecX family transcriptional regulator [Longimicrobiales bacterium]